MPEQQFRFHQTQSDLYRTPVRFPVVLAGRGSGKSAIFRKRTRRALFEHVASTATPMYFYLLPTFGQAKRVAWKPFLDEIPKEYIKKENHTDLVITTIFGSELHIIGMDQPQRFEGNQWAGGIMDECSDHKPKVFDLTIEPALTAHNGWCWRGGVPKRHGTGAEDFKAAYDIGVAGLDPQVRSYHWESESILTAEEIARLKARLDVRDYNEQYKAKWEKSSGAIFFTFERQLHVDEHIIYHTGLPICVGSDYNVNPMCWTLSHAYNGGIYTFDEIMLRNTNTRETISELVKRYGKHESEFWFFGDASSRARKTSSDTTDLIQLHNSPLKKKRFFYPNANPSTAARFSACNALLLSADGHVRAKIHPRCKRLIADLEHRSYKERSREPNDKGDMGHMSDAWGYTIVATHPLDIHLDEPATVSIR